MRLDLFRWGSGLDGCGEGPVWMWEGVEEEANFGLGAVVRRQRANVKSPT